MPEEGEAERKMPGETSYTAIGCILKLLNKLVRGNDADPAIFSDTKNGTCNTMPLSCCPLVEGVVLTLKASTFSGLPSAMRTGVDTGKIATNVNDRTFN